MFRSLCRQHHRNLDAVRRSIANRVGCEIDDAQLRLMGGMYGVTERLFVATAKAGRWLQTDAVAIGARDARSSLQPNIKFARAGRLAGIEACGANRDFDRHFLTNGLDRTEEHGARGYSGGANKGLRSERRVRVHLVPQCRLVNSG